MNNRTNQEIAYVIMKTDKYNALMRGSIIYLDRDELDDYISYQVELNINTILIQRGSYGYSVKVDRPTVERYFANMKETKGVQLCQSLNIMQ